MNADTFAARAVQRNAPSSTGGFLVAAGSWGIDRILYSAAGSCARVAIRRMSGIIVATTIGALGHAALAPAPVVHSTTTSETGATQEVPGPRIEFASPIFDFGRVKQDEAVRHEFVFNNLGTTPLTVTDVTPGCSCTTVGTWDRRVEPGRSGVIPILFNSASFVGPVDKTVTVTCDDPRQSLVSLRIKGTVWRVFDVVPSMAVFNVSSETETYATKVIRIVSQSEEPVTLSDPECANPSFKMELTTVRPGREFELHVTALPPFTGSSVSAPITLKTSSPDMPGLKIGAHVMVQPSVVAVPNRITFPAATVPTGFSTMVTIRNYGKNPLVLSDARVNVPDAGVHVQEVESGRIFRITVTFPAGFAPKAKDDVAITMKSSHPKFPVIRVPVVTAPHVDSKSIHGQELRPVTLLPRAVAPETESKK